MTDNVSSKNGSVSPVPMCSPSFEHVDLSIDDEVDEFDAALALQTSHEEDDIYKGKIFLTRDLTEVKKIVENHANNRNFDVCIAKGTDMRDIPGARKLVMKCGRGGVSKKNKGGVLKSSVGGNRNLQPKQSRASSSLKCGCEWEVRARINDHVSNSEITKASLVHTNGCEPSPEQHQLQVQRRGQTLYLPFEVASTLHHMFESRAHLIGI